MGAGSLPAPHGPQKYNTKEFNPCAFMTKESGSTSTEDSQEHGNGRNVPAGERTHPHGGIEQHTARK